MLIAIHLLCGVTEDVKPFADRLGCGARVPANGAKNLVHPRLSLHVGEFVVLVCVSFCLLLRKNMMCYGCTPITFYPWPHF